MSTSLNDSVNIDALIKAAEILEKRNCNRRVIENGSLPSTSSYKRDPILNTDQESGINHVEMHLSRLEYRSRHESVNECGNHVTPDELNGATSAMGNEAYAVWDQYDNQKSVFDKDVRKVHNQLEKHRRADLKLRFDRLKEQVPNTMGKRCSSLAILRGALRYIQMLSLRDHEYELMLGQLVDEKSQIMKRHEGASRCLHGAGIKPLTSLSSPGDSALRGASSLYQEVHSDHEESPVVHEIPRRAKRRRSDLMETHIRPDNESTTTASECGDGEDTDDASECGELATYMTGVSSSPCSSGARSPILQLHDTVTTSASVITASTQPLLVEQPRVTYSLHQRGLPVKKRKLNWALMHQEDEGSSPVSTPSVLNGSPGESAGQSCSNSWRASSLPTGAAVNGVTGLDIYPRQSLVKPLLLSDNSPNPATVSVRLVNSVCRPTVDPGSKLLSSSDGASLLYTSPEKGRHNSGGGQMSVLQRTLKETELSRSLNASLGSKPYIGRGNYRLSAPQRPITNSGGSSLTRNTSIEPPEALSPAWMNQRMLPVYHLLSSATVPPQVSASCPTTSTPGPKELAVRSLITSRPAVSSTPITSRGGQQGPFIFSLPVHNNKVVPRGATSNSSSASSLVLSSSSSLSPSLFNGDLGTRPQLVIPVTTMDPSLLVMHSLMPVQLASVPPQQDSASPPTAAFLNAGRPGRAVESLVLTRPREQPGPNDLTNKPLRFSN